MSLKPFVFSCLVLFLQCSSVAFAKQECSKDFLLTYFPEPFVNQTLEKFHIPKDDWAAISKELKAKDNEVTHLVESRASKMNPNPLLDPSQREVAVKLFRESLFQIFSDVLQEHGVTDQKKIREMLDDIQIQRADQFTQCVEDQEAKGYHPPKEESFEHED